MKLRWKWALVMTVVLSLLACGALAASRYTAISTDGVVLSSPDALRRAYRMDEHNVPTYILSAQVNSNLTDWNQLMLDGSSYGLMVEMTPPTAAEYAQLSGYTCVGVGAYEGGATYFEYPDQVAEAQGKADASTQTTYLYDGYEAVKPDSTHTMLIPYVNEPSEGYYFAHVCWKFEKGSDVKYIFERYFFSTVHSNPDPIQLNSRYATSAMMQPMMNPGNGVSSEYESGTLNLTIPKEANGGNFFTLDLKLAGPSGTAWAELIYDEMYYYAQEQGNGIYTFQFDPGPNSSDPKQDFLLPCKPKGNVEVMSNCMVKWYDENDNLLNYGLFSIYTIPEEHEPFPVYLADWEPVYKGQIDIQNNMKNTGVQAIPSDGWIRIEQDGSVPNGNVDSIIYSIMPPSASDSPNVPDNLTHYRIWYAGGEGEAFGRGKEEGMFRDFAQAVSEGFSASMIGDKIRLGEESPLYYQKAKSVSLYLQEDYTPWSVGVVLVYWYANGDTDTPVYKQYLNVKTEELFDYEREQPITMVDEESDITSPVNYTTIVKPASLSGSLEGWALVSRVDLQNGEDAYHRELYTINETGAKNKLKLANGETMVLYIPYPEDFAYGTDEVFYAYHYASENYNKAPERLVGENTPWGVRFEVTSLSPFVFSWADEAVVSVAANVPQTGDPTPLFAIVCMLALSFGGMLIISRKRQRA